MDFQLRFDLIHTHVPHVLATLILDYGTKEWVPLFHIVIRNKHYECGAVMGVIGNKCYWFYSGIMCNEKRLSIYRCGRIQPVYDDWVVVEHRLLHLQTKEEIAFQSFKPNGHPEYSVWYMTPYKGKVYFIKTNYDDRVVVKYDIRKRRETVMEHTSHVCEIRVLGQCLSFVSMNGFVHLMGDDRHFYSEFPLYKWKSIIYIIGRHNIQNHKREICFRISNITKVFAFDHILMVQCEGNDTFTTYMLDLNTMKQTSMDGKEEFFLTGNRVYSITDSSVIIYR